MFILGTSALASNCDNTVESRNSVNATSTGPDVFIEPRFDQSQLLTQNAEVHMSFGKNTPGESAPPSTTSPTQSKAEGDQQRSEREQIYMNKAVFIHNPLNYGCRDDRIVSLSPIRTRLMPTQDWNEDSSEIHVVDQMKRLLSKDASIKYMDGSGLLESLWGPVSHKK